MPKILSPQAKHDVVSLFYLGYSRDEIAQTLGIGAGTASKILKEFQAEIGDAEYEAIKIWARYLRKNGIKAENAVIGARIWDVLKKNAIKEDDLYSFFENLSSIKNVPDVSNLLIQANNMISIRKDTGESFVQIVQKYEELSRDIPDLSKRKNLLQSEIKGLEAQRNAVLKKNNATEQQLGHLAVIKSECYSIGLKLEDLLKYSKALKEIKRRNYDVLQLLDYLHKIEDTENQIKKAKLTRQNYQNDIDAAKNEWQSTAQKLKKTKLQYIKLSTAIKIIQEFAKNNQDPLTVIGWNKILKQNHMSIQKLGSELKTYGNFARYLAKLANDTALLEKNKENLKSKTAQLEAANRKLGKLLVMSQTLLDQKIDHAKKEIEKLSVNPLWLISQSKKPYEVLPILLILFSTLRTWLDKQNIDSFTIRNAVDGLTSEIEKILNKK